MASAGLKQRILGAAVVLSIGFIAYSILIQSSSGTYIDRSAQIPIQTKYIEPLDLPEPQGVVDRDIDAPAQAFTSRQPADASKIADAPVLNENGNPNAWVIQVGSFATHERAIEVRDQLIGEGYKSYYRPIQDEQGDEELHRIMVGPYINATEVAEHREGINQLLGVDTILMEYAP